MENDRSICNGQMVERSFSKVNQLLCRSVARTMRVGNARSSHDISGTPACYFCQLSAKIFYLSAKRHTTILRVADISSRRRLSSECSPATAAFMARQNLCMVLGGGCHVPVQEHAYDSSIDCQEGKLRDPPAELE
ncbi:hypothetical protein, partial [Achromobacter sp.]|uniref:hypothetical protein n=1 Tax=Achromobacter sp. TaxID=134375 RepID=UPI002899E938